MKNHFAFVISFLLITGVGALRAADVTTGETRSVAKDAFIYGFAFVENYRTLYKQAVDAKGADYKATFNQIGHSRAVATPANAFWSITMYDGKTQHLVANSLDRYLLNSTMLKSLNFADDGSLTISVQKDSPGVSKEANWLPAPDGPFYIIMRIYFPKPEGLDGTWKKPGLMPSRKMSKIGGFYSTGLLADWATERGPTQILSR